ncbi:MAG TPA: trifunctional transcriptional regulator/proline dehydrogenase/L-glutamate gamma-semialdehyde dehydrogenase, partial [Candidimonas sp.]|nr:trifunctional transcriptional regulator/proline dehydrogenase/L-glutamate gamma-semialdehyde dehydrogenase [Candidimonas sp.]
MATTTLGVKVDETLRERLKVAAGKLGCTPHWLHKQAVLAYVDAIERGQLPAEISYFGATDGDTSVDESVNVDQSSPFYEFAQDIQPQSVLRAAITSAYRRPETECVPVLIDQARAAQSQDVQALARRLVEALRGKRKSGGVEALIQEFSLSSQEGVALMCLAEALLRIPDRATRDALIRDKISHGDWRSHMG